MNTSKGAPDPAPQTSDDIILRPVGVIRNDITEPFLTATDHGLELGEKMEAVRAAIREMRQRVSQIIIRRDWMDLLDGLDGYSHGMLLYWGHRVPEHGRGLTRVHPMGRKEFPLTGIFATCSPARPNPVLMSVVRLHSRKDNVLKVSGTDAVNGSPVIDIKPYVKEWYPQTGTTIPPWMQQILDEAGEGKES